MYPVKRQSESCPPPVVEVAPPFPVNQAAFQPVPGLTIYMHPPRVLTMNEYGPLMVLFESFHRSNVNFSFDTKGLSCHHDQEVVRKCDWKTNLFIEGKLISSGIQKKELESKKEAAAKALAILRECQPVHVNSAQETFYTIDEAISGLVLHFKDSKQSGTSHKAEWYDVLMDSCKKCGLEVSWWENFGAMFQTRWLVVLLVNSKPMAVSWAYTLEDAKRKAGTSAVSLAKFRHQLRFENDNSVSLTSVYLKYPQEELVTDAYTILERSARVGPGKSFKIVGTTEKDEGTGNTTFFSDLYFYDNLIASGKGLSKKKARKNAADQGLQKLMQALPVVYDKEGPEKVLEGAQHPETSITQEPIPGLICYLKRDELLNSGNTMISTVLQRAASRFNCSIDVHQDGTVFSEKLGRHLVKASLYIGEHLFSTGVGVKLEVAKSDAFKKGYIRLRFNQPIVYIDSDCKDTEPCSHTSNTELHDSVITEVHNNNPYQGVNKRKYGGETSEEKESFVIRSEWKDSDGALLLSDIIDDVDKHALIKKYIGKYVDI